jgi:hypothetical protein
MIIVVASLPIDPGKVIGLKNQSERCCCSEKRAWLGDLLPGTFNFRPSLHGRFPVIFNKGMTSHWFEF